MFETEHRGADNGQKRFSRRALFVGLLQVAGMTAIGGRLYQLQVLDQRQYDQLAKRNRTTRQTLAPLRGRIFDRDGNLLADTQEFYQALVTPSLTTNIDEVLEVLGRIKAIPAQDYERIRAAVKQRTSAVPVLVASSLTWKELAAINLNAPLLAGVHTEIGGRRQYYHGATMGRIIGYVGSVERFALDDDPAMHMPDMRTGKAGVERGLNKELIGTSGFVERLVDARGRIVRNLRQTDPKRGQDVAVTVDVELQRRLH